MTGFGTFSSNRCNAQFRELSEVQRQRLHECTDGVVKLHHSSFFKTVVGLRVHQNNRMDRACSLKPRKWHLNPKNDAFACSQHVSRTKCAIMARYDARSSSPIRPPLRSPAALLRPSGEQPLDAIQHELVVVRPLQRRPDLT
jgi:hypothetical protein